MGGLLVMASARTGQEVMLGSTMDGMNELNKGPRARSCKNEKMYVPTSLAVRGHPDDEKSHLHVVLEREKYNRPDFPETYADAKFFVIESYSEDDVHKSIKYSVWSSTPNGNKKLDAAYKEAQQKSGPCPEVKLEQGFQILKIFKDHVSRSCMLEDFGFYEGRQKAIQEKKAKQQLQKKVREGKNIGEKNKDGANGELKLLNSADGEL